MPYALKNIRWLLHNVTLPVALPTLMDAFHNMLRSEKLLALATDADNLVVEIVASLSIAGCQRTKAATAADSFLMDAVCRIRAGRSD